VEFKGLIKNISNREKTLAAGAVLLLIIFLVYQFVFVPLLTARESLQYEKTELENQLGNIKVLAERYVSERQYYDALVKSLKNKQNVSVLTYLENESQNTGIRDSIEYVRPRGDQTKDGVQLATVEIKVDAIPARDLLIFLANVEQHRDGLIITYLRLKPFFKDREKVDAFIRITDVTVE